MVTFSFSMKYVSLQNLLQRNEQLYGSGDDAPSGGVALPFILVQVDFFYLKYGPTDI
jgi:hypothetical protein